MKIIRLSILVFFFAFAYSCDLIEDVVNEEPIEEEEDILLDSEIIEGLKTALAVGTDSSSSFLSKVDGYYGDLFFRIPLPEEVENVRTNVVNIVNDVPLVSELLDLDQQFENVIKSINKAAESAASEASPVFKDAITSLSIADGLDILQGVNPLDTLQKTDFDSTAATSYFKMATTTALTQIYGGKIDIALDADLGLGFSANDAWSTLSNTYNNAVTTITGSFILNSAVELAGYELNTLETESIGEFATGKALNGLFYLVGEEEKKIRKNPLDWALTTVGAILERVFTWFEENIK